MIDLPLDLEDLQRKAEVATQGEWSAMDLSGDVWKLEHPRKRICEHASTDNAAFIAAANPETILALIAELKEVNGLLEEYHRFGLVIDSSVRFSEWDSENAEAISDLILRHTNRHRARKALAEQGGADA